MNLFTANSFAPVAAEERTDHRRWTCVSQDGVDPKRGERSSAGPLAGGVQRAGAGRRGPGRGYQVETHVH